jgi:YcaO-like protein with predicted kinase domain
MSGRENLRALSWRNATHPEPAGLKHYLQGTHRVCSPEETIARLQPLLSAFGITRVANLTGLDRTGIPVVAVYRPNARSVTISQGKGLTLEAAKASGLMESVEVWHAEHIVKPLKLASAAEMRREHRLINIRGLPMARGSRYGPDLPLLWIEAEEILAGGSIWVPFELVSANYTLPLPPGSGSFQANTNGLASGNHWLEAVSHALCEVVERDARTLWQQRSPAAVGHLAVEPASIDDPASRELLERLESAGLEARIWDVTSDVGIASFVCALRERSGEEIDPELGSGCHPARHIALARALTEAGQARNTYITAARDDFFPEMYLPSQRARRQAHFQRLFAPFSKGREFGHVPIFESASIEADLRWMLARLRSAGIDQVAVVELTRESIGIPVARVVVPGLEGALDDAYTPGTRARRALETVA